MLRDVALVLVEEGANMREIRTESLQNTNLATLTATLEITAVSQLTSILDKIERLPNVIEVSRAETER